MLGAFNIMMFLEPIITLRDVTRAYEDSKIPVILLDRSFSPVYSNRAATSVCKILLSTDFLRRHLSEEEREVVLKELETSTFYRLIPEKTTVFKAFVFGVVFDAKGNRLPFIKLQTEDAYSAEDFLNVEFSGGKLASMIANSLISPLGVMSAVLDLLERRVGSDEKNLLYIDSIFEKIYQLERGVSRIASIYTTFASYGRFNVSAFDPVPYIKALTEELKTPFSTDISENSVVVFLDREAFRKAFLDIYCYISGFGSAFKVRHSVETRLREERRFFVAEVSRKGVLRAEAAATDPYALNIDKNGELTNTLLFAKRIFEAAGGSLEIRLDGKGKSANVLITVCLPTALPESDILGSGMREFVDFRNIEYRAVIEKIKKNLSEC